MTTLTDLRVHARACVMQDAATGRMAIDESGLAKRRAALPGSCAHATSLRAADVHFGPREVDRRPFEVADLRGAEAVTVGE